MKSYYTLLQDQQIVTFLMKYGLDWILQFKKEVLNLTSRANACSFLAITKVPQCSIFRHNWHSLKVQPILLHDIANDNCSTTGNSIATMNQSLSIACEATVEKFSCLREMLNYILSVMIHYIKHQVPVKDAQVIISRIHRLTSFRNKIFFHTWMTEETVAWWCGLPLVAEHK